MLNDLWLILTSEPSRNFLTVLNCVFSLGILAALWSHHRAGVSGPMSASTRLLTAMTDLRARIDLMDRLLDAHDSRLKSGGL